MKKVIFYLITVLSFVLMFINYIIPGVALLLISAFAFAPGKMKHNEKWQRFYQSPKMKRIRKLIMILILLSIVVLMITYPKLNIIVPLFFIAALISPSQKGPNPNQNDHDIINKIQLKFFYFTLLLLLKYIDNIKQLIGKLLFNLSRVFPSR